MPSTSTDRLNGLTTSVAVKAPVAWISTTNITLSGLATGHAEGDRHLVVGQTDATENGIYDESSGSWTRSTDFDGERDVVNGTLIISPTAGVIYQVQATDPIEFGTTELTITGFDLPLSTYNAASYGAAHNVESATAIQSALDAASAANEVALAPGGTLLISAELEWPSAGVKLRGAGIGRTILKANNVAVASVIVNANPPGSSPILTHVATRTGATSFTIASDVTTLYRKGRRIYINGAMTGTLQRIVETVSYLAPDTTVTIDSGALVAEALTASAMTFALNSEGDADFTDHDIEIEDLTIDCNSIALRGIFLQGVRNIRLTNVEIKNSTTGHGVRIIYFDGLWVDRCYFHSNGGNGIGASIGDNAYLTNVRSDANGDNGNTLQSVRNGVMDGCSGHDNDGSGGTFEDNATGIGDPLADGRNEHLRAIGYDGSFNGSHGFLCATKGTHYFQINGGMFGWNGKSGIAGSGGVAGTAEYGQIMNTQCHDNVQHGIEGSSEGVSYMRRMIALGNLCFNNGSDGINTPSSINVEDWLIVGNMSLDTQLVATQNNAINVQSIGSERMAVIANHAGANQAISIVSLSDGLVASNLVADKSRDHDVGGVSVASNGTTIDVSDGVPVIRLVGTAGTVVALTGFVGQTVVIHSTIAASVIDHSASLRCPLAGNLTLDQNENATFSCISNLVWTCLGTEAT